MQLNVEPKIHITGPKKPQSTGDPTYECRKEHGARFAERATYLLWLLLSNSCVCVRVFAEFMLQSVTCATKQSYLLR